MQVPQSCINTLYHSGFMAIIFLAVSMCKKNIHQQAFFFGIDYVANEGCHVINPFPFPLAIPSLYCTCSINDYFDLQIYPKFKMMKLEMAQRL